jgi:hypothetical protein
LRGSEVVGWFEVVPGKAGRIIPLNTPSPFMERAGG